MSARTLVVDDDQATCRMIELGLKADGHAVAIARSVSEAIDVANSFEPEVVLTDLNMARASGLDLCRHFAESWPDVPVILVTAFGSLDTAVEALRAGAYDFITKPFDIQRLAMLLQQVPRISQIHAD